MFSIKVLLGKDEISRKTCFNDVQFGDQFNVGITGVNGVYIKELLIDDKLILSKFWMDNHNDCRPFKEPAFTAINITSNETSNTVKTSCDN